MSRQSSCRTRGPRPKPLGSTASDGLPSGVGDERRVPKGCEEVEGAQKRGTCRVKLRTLLRPTNRCVRYVPSQARHLPREAAVLLLARRVPDGETKLRAAKRHRVRAERASDCGLRRTGHPSRDSATSRVVCVGKVTAVLDTEKRGRARVCITSHHLGGCLGEAALLYPVQQRRLAHVRISQQNHLHRRAVGGASACVRKWKLAVKRPFSRGEGVCASCGTHLDPGV